MENIFTIYYAIVVIWDKFWWIIPIIVIYIWIREYKKEQEAKIEDLVERIHINVTKPIQNSIEDLTKEVKKLKK